MKKAIVAILVAAVFASPCIYDAVSPEPSPIAGLVAMMTPQDTHAIALSHGWDAFYSCEEHLEDICG
ncbi:hypothetical protein [Agrobacterium sp. CG674]